MRHWPPWATRYPRSDMSNENDSLLFWGTGDPAFLYGNVKSTSVVFDFLQRQPSALYFSPANGATVYLGPRLGVG